MAGIVDQGFWRGKRVLVTGHSGFKGSWLTIWLNRLRADVTGISLPPSTAPSLFTEAKVDRLCTNHFCDIRNGPELDSLIHAACPEVVIHLAAQPLVRESYGRPLETFDINLLGTVRVLESLRSLESARVALIVTTDKVYRQSGSRVPFTEADPLGGHDPYSASKACCEIAVESYRNSFLAERGVAVASARAGNVIGGGDWATDRLIPDAIRAWQDCKTLHVRNPESTRPWQHVLEALWGYLVAVEKIWQSPELAGPYNFGPSLSASVTVRELVQLAKDAYGTGDVHFSEHSQGPHESSWLKLDAESARTNLGVCSKLSVQQAMDRTIQWYKSHKAGADAGTLCLAEIAQYEAMQ